VVEWRVTCAPLSSCQLTWKPVVYVEVSGSSTNMEEARCSSYCSNEQRCGSDRLSATALAVDENARSDFQRQYAVGGDDPCFKRRGRSISPILSTHSFLSTTDFLSCLSCSPFDRRLTGQLQAGHGTCGRTARDHLNEPCQPAHMLLTVSACSAK